MTPGTGLCEFDDQIIMRKNKAPRTGKTEPHSKKVAIYIRVSTSYQVDKDSLPMQRKDLTAYSSLILGIDDYEIFEDAGYSGKNTDRPAYQEMMKRIRSGEFSHLLVWKIDRISRKLLDFAEMYEELQDLRVTFVSKNEQFDTSNAMGEAMLKIILVFAELERNMTSERVTATMISRASSGQWNGGRIPFGYDYNSESGQFSIKNDEASVCLILKDDYLKHKSLVHTSRLLNSKGYKTRANVDWSPTSVWIIAKSPFYAGIYRYNRYKGTESRTENPPEEWVMVQDHHPAIFTLEEHEKMLDILSTNSRQMNLPGQRKASKHVYVFGNLMYCGKCGSKLVSTPGRLHADGFRASNYSCPKHRKTKECDNPTISDVIIGEFVINYIVNMLNAKASFSSINSPEELQARLLSGAAFRSVNEIGHDGLCEFYNLLSRYRSDKSFTLSISKPKKAVSTDPEISSLRKDKERQERALKRLQDLYLYSEHAMSEKDFIIRKKEITSAIEHINTKLGMMTHNAESSLSDEEFVRQASHLLIQKKLQGREYIYYKKLAQDVSPEILKTYMDTIIDSIYTKNGTICGLVFKNGLRHDFT